MNNSKEILSVFLPEGVLDYFDCLNARVVDNVIMVRLQEKECVPEIPKEHYGKKIVSKGFRDISVEDFPVRGKKVNLLVRRRIWKIEGVKELLKRDLPITFPNTKLQKEFAVFLKGGDRKRTSGNFTSSENI
jgi:hypothetical protein